MAIIPLSDDTVRLLGSHTVITTPVDLAKELLDNAIDAKATSVDVLVSRNMVDRIEVRDNGHGIHSDDHDSLGRAGHTSKMTSVEHLRTLGGTTLGFRGQALASANNLGVVTVTTRTAGDPTAVVLKLSPGVGGVASQQRSPAPVGTTVAVTGLYGRLPVREQVAVRDAIRHLARLKRVLQAYALARPQIRLTFRVLGGDNKLAFSYCPRPGTGMKEAVMQIFGTDLSSQCLIDTICSTADNKSSEEGNVENEKYCIRTVLPRPDADQACVSKGSFFSVDSRPVSAQRGTMKKLLTLFKSYFSTSVATAHGEASSRDPFICVNIHCSPASYDPNIEPSKDAVLFANEFQVTSLFERLCTEVYKSQETCEAFDTTSKRRLNHGPQTRTPPTSSDSPGVEGIAPTVRLNDSHQESHQMQCMPFPSSSSPVRELQKRPAPRHQPAPAKPDVGFTIDMSADPGLSSDEDSSQEKAISQTEGEDGGSREALNPWVIAKLNAPTRQKHAVHVPEPPLPMVDEVFENLPVLRPFGEAPGDLGGSREVQLGLAQRDCPQQLPGLHHSHHLSAVYIPNDDHLVNHEEVALSSHLDETTTRNTLPNLRFRQKEAPEGAELNGLVQTRLALGEQPERTHNIKDVETRRHIDELPSRKNPPFRKPKRVNAGKRRSLVTNPVHSNEHVAEWVDNHRFAGSDSGSMRHPSTQPLSPSPLPSAERPASEHPTRQGDSAVKQASARHSNETWADGDSRKFLMKRQRSEVEHHRRGRPRIKRIKTDTLPLETIPEAQRLQGVVLIVELGEEIAASNLEDMMGKDTFCDTFHTGIDLSEEMSFDDATEVELRLKDLMAAWTEKVLGKRAEVKIDLRTQAREG